MQMKTIKNAFTICISPILHLPRPPNGLCNLCFLFLMGIQSSQKKLKTISLCKIWGGGQKRCIMGDVQMMENDKV